MTNGMGGASKIIPRTYKSGSIIYFEGDKSEYIYVLKAGRVILTSAKLDTGEEVKEEVRQGEFFGVKSSLGKYPREETAQTFSETVVLVLSLADFEKLVIRNIDVVRKMLRVFSNQLRRLGKMQRTVLGEADTINPDMELFRIGEYYFKAGVFQQAQYAFKKFMQYYPDSKYASTAMDRINAIASGRAVPETAPDLPVKGRSRIQEPESDFTFDGMEGEPGMEGAEKSADKGPTINDEMNDFLSDDGLTDLDDFSESGSPKGDSNYIKELFENGGELYSSGEYGQALEVYEKIISSDDIETEEDRIFYENAHFQIGMCNLNLGKQKEALNAFSTVLKNFPSSRNLKKAVYYIARICENAKQNEKAVQYYKRAASMPPQDDMSKQAAMKVKQLQG
jgi:TolA-binding protein